MDKRVIGAAAVACVAFASTGVQAAAWNGSGWKADFVQLKAEIQARYANLAWKAAPQSGVDLPTLDRRTAQALDAARSDAEAARAMRAFVAGFQDGHFSEQVTLAKATAALPPEPPAPMLDPADPVTGCAALGFASTGPVAFSLPFESQPGFVLVADGLTRPFRAGLIHADGRAIGIVRIQNFRARVFPAVCLSAWAQVKASGAPVTARAVRDAARTGWFAALATTLHDLQTRGATAIVVDVGDDSGGDDSGDWTARLFTDRLVRSAPLLMVDAPVSAGYFDEQLGDLAAGIDASPNAAALRKARDGFAAAKASIGSATCDLSWAWRERREWHPNGCNRLVRAGYAGGWSAGLPVKSPDTPVATLLTSTAKVRPWFGAWTGPTYVLTNQRSYSSAEMFAAVMQDNHIARLIGVRTGGDGCGFMTDGPPVTLTHSNLRFRIPNCMRLRADGTDEEAGVSPDLPILPTEGESDRARAARALRVLAADMDSDVAKRERR